MSVIVPCASQHVEKLGELLIALAGQNLPPDEVCVSISERSALDLHELRVIDLSALPFRVLVAADPRVAFAGANRNRAADISTGDLLIYNDADDLPHVQRIEIIKTIFETKQVDHLAHAYFHDLDECRGMPYSMATTYEIASIVRDHTVAKTHHEPDAIHSGNIATTRAVFEQVRWNKTQKRAQDQTYNLEVYDRFTRTVHVTVPLLLYRQQQTTAPTAPTS